MADKAEHMNDINEWLKDMEVKYRDHLHAEHYIINLLKERLAYCMEVIDVLLNEEQ